MKISELLAEGYPDTIAAFNQVAEPELVKQTVDAYRELVNKNQVVGNERNIDWWKKQGWDKFSQFVADKSTQATKTQVKRKKAAGKSITLKETPDWLIVIPLDHDASCYHGRGSDWCTARPTAHHFDHYFLDKDVVLIYCLNKTKGDKYAIASHPGVKNRIELFNKQDKPINEQQFQSLTGFDPHALIDLIPHNDPRIAQVKTERRTLLAQIKKLIDKWEKGDHLRDKTIEDLLIKAKHPELCLRYISKVSNNPQEYPVEIAMAAVKRSGQAIEYIKNPNEAVQMSAVKESRQAIHHIKNPSEAIQMAAVTKSGQAIEYIKNPSEAVQMAAITQNGVAIQHIINKGIVPSEAVQLVAVTQYGWIILYINNPSEAVQMAAVTKSGQAIEHIKNPSEAVQMAAVTEYGWTIRFIKNPSEPVQMAAVIQYGGAIRYIKNPLPEVIELARSKGYDAKGNEI